jgi:starch phosphorylase
VYQIPDEELWRVHETRRERLVAFCRRRLSAQVQAAGGSSLDMRRAQEVLNSEALTIGFARRFAPYKRAGLLFTDPQRLLRMISDKRRPVQFIFAGKAHPRDNKGKELIKRVVHQARSEGFSRNLVFLQNYDINIARYLVQGVDVWLNTPRRPMEACGTSGMKAAANGVLNMSVLDGWWPEAYDGENGWAIGGGKEYEDHEYQDRIEALEVYDILEQQVIPTFFDRGPDGLPRRWIRMMKNSMARICVRFNSHRMIEEYMEDYYVHAALAHQVLGENRLSRAAELRDWRRRVHECWPGLKVIDVSESRSDRLSLGEELHVQASIDLGGLTDHEVIVDLCHGTIESESDKLINRSITTMTSKERVSEGVWRFEGSIRCDETGVYGYTIRVLPFHPYLFNPFSMNLVAWG